MMLKNFARKFNIFYENYKYSKQLTVIYRIQESLIKCVDKSSEVCPDLQIFFKAQLLRNKAILKKFCPDLSISVQSKGL